MIKLKKFKSVGIVGFGAYVPAGRLKLKTIARAWQKDGQEVERSLGLVQKSVADKDEDAITLAVEAAQAALKQAKLDPKKIGAIFIGSESHPYAVKPSGTVVAQALGMDNNYFCADLEFACKAATVGMQIIASMIEAGLIDYGLVIGSDKAQARPGDVLEYTAAAGAAAFILGSRKQEFLAALEHTNSFNSDTPDFWRREGESYPQHAGRFTGEPGYFYHMKKCLQGFLKQTQQQPSDFDQVVFHMPNVKFPQKLARTVGFSTDQLKTGFIVKDIG
ncbi:hydroxymethylglutaryl-CoA synthase, partial [Patescibacteria group bacterium]|nr:hydroxymethylglutaryl-CoA synthase [Patescibacteria group bacterium]